MTFGEKVKAERTKLGLNQDELAEKLGTINYEITCMISRRVPRFYIQNNKMKFYKSYLSDLAISMYNI